MCSDASKGQFESACDEHTFDPSLAKMERARTNIVFGEGSGDDGDDAVAAIEIPKTDLVGIVGKACIEKMVRADNVVVHYLALYLIVALFRGRRKARQHGRCAKQRWTMSKSG